MMSQLINGSFRALGRTAATLPGAVMDNVTGSTFLKLLEVLVGVNWLAESRTYKCLWPAYSKCLLLKD